MVNETSLKSDQIKNIKNLAKGILIQSLNDRVKGNRQDGQDAESWLFSDDISYTFSFTNCCRLLNLSPQKIRSAVRDNTLSGALEEYRRLQLNYGHHFDKVIGL